MAKYNVKKVVAVFTPRDPRFGSVTFTGFMGDFITITPQQKRATKHVDEQGKATVVLNPDKGADIKIMLRQNSASNDLLFALVPDADTDTLIEGDFMMTDLSDGTVCAAEIAWLTNPAEVKRGKEIVGYEWMLDCEAMNFEKQGDIL